MVGVGSWWAVVVGGVRTKSVRISTRRSPDSVSITRVVLTLAPGLPAAGGAGPGLFSFSPRLQTLYYRPHPHELSPDGAAFTADVVVPVAEGLVTAVGLRDASFEGIDFEHMVRMVNFDIDFFFWTIPISQPLG